MLNIIAFIWPAKFNLSVHNINQTTFAPCVPPNNDLHASCMTPGQCKFYKITDQEIAAEVSNTC